MDEERRVENEDALELEILLAYSPPPFKDALTDQIMETVRTAPKPAEIKAEPGGTRVGRIIWAAIAAMIVASGLTVWAARPSALRGSLKATEKTVVALGDRATATVEAPAEIDYVVEPAFLFWDDTALVDQGKGVVRYRVNRGGPFVVRTPSCRVRVTGTDFKVEVLEMKNQKSKALAGVGIGLATLVTVYAGSVVVENDNGSVTLTTGQIAVAEPGKAPTLNSSEESTPNFGDEEKADSSKTLARKFRRLKNDQIRQEMVAAIKNARQLRLARQSQEDIEKQLNDPEQMGELTKEVIRDVMREIIPDVQKCYETALEKDPSLNGLLPVKFNIAAEPDAGGLVEDFEFMWDGADKSLSSNQAFLQCVTDVVMSVEFPPPKDGGFVTVGYPFIFSKPEE